MCGFAFLEHLAFNNQRCSHEIVQVGIIDCFILFPSFPEHQSEIAAISHEGVFGNSSVLILNFSEGV